MSRLVLVLLIALLPLRGWAAERMAVYMAASEAAAVAMVSEAQAMPADCPMLMQADNAEPGADQGDSKGHHGCHSCQLCMSLVAQATEVQTAVIAEPFATATARTDRFVSADLLRAVKPPIS